MSKKAFVARITAILSLILVLITVIVVLEPERKDEGITRARAAKAVALMMESREEILQYEEESGRSYFSQKEQNNWYVPYMDYLYEKKILSEDLTKPSAAEAQKEITYEEVSHIAAAFSKPLEASVGLVRKNRSHPYPEEDFWQFYDKLLEETGAAETEDGVRTLEVLLYGTPANVQPSESWTAYTSEGDFRFEGLALDAYIDCKLEIMVRNEEMIAVRKVISEDVVYENVWLDDSGSETFQVHLGSICRTFSGKGIENLEEFRNNLVDLELNSGNLVKISVQNDRITGKVLSAGKNGIEIEGYGLIPLEKNFRVHKVYGEYQELELSDILVGYDNQEFVTSNGKLCAALITREFDAEKIRVLLMNTGFQSIFHPSVTFTADTGAVLTYGKKEKKLEAGESLTIEPGSKYLKEGRLKVQPETEDGRILISSISRNQGTPAYCGTIEIKEEAEGLTIVNDLYLEDYLKTVVSSEMPASYELEALKAQAVCARTYAYRQILGNSYSQYGAHVDDSTNFQVYNNTEESTRTTEAVNETYGQMLFYEGNAIEAFYFSTSCGHTTDGSAWGGSGEKTPYLKARELRDRKEQLDLSSNAAFSEFIKNKDYPAYDQSYPMYRWETRIQASDLEKKIPELGTVTDVEITERGPGGVAQKLTLYGTSGEKKIEGQNQIRSILGDSALEIAKKDGSTQTGFSILPSAYISIEKRTGADGILSFYIYGGGYGHGAGMSQNGAQEMAKDGKDYQAILNFFYEGAEIREAN